MKGQSYIIRTDEGREVFLIQARGVEANEGERVTVLKGNVSVSGIVSRKFTQRNRPARQRRGR